MNRPAGVTLGNVLLAVASLLLVVAAVYPRLARGARRQAYVEIIEQVERMRETVEAERRRSGRWPATGDVTSLSPPAEVEAKVPAAIEWRRLTSFELPEAPSAEDIAEESPDVEDEPTAPRPSFFERGMISVHTSDPGLSAALVERYGLDRSLVQDTVWSLLLPRIPSPPD